MHRYRGRSPELRPTARKSGRTWVFGPVATWGKVCRSGVVSILLLGLATTLHSADLDDLARGEALLQEKCGRCHAIGPVGESPLKQAPPMRHLYLRFAPRELQAELMEGMVSRHKDMPQIDFSEEDTHAILAYLHVLATRK